MRTLKLALAGATLAVLAGCGGGGGGTASPVASITTPPGWDSKPSGVPYGIHTYAGDLKRHNYELSPDGYSYRIVSQDEYEFKMTANFISESGNLSYESEHGDLDYRIDYINTDTGYFYGERDIFGQGNRHTTIDGYFKDRKVDGNIYGTIGTGYGDAGEFNGVCESCK